MNITRREMIQAGETIRIACHSGHFHSPRTTKNDSEVVTSMVPVTARP